MGSGVVAEEKRSVSEVLRDYRVKDGTAYYDFRKGLRAWETVHLRMSF